MDPMYKLFLEHLREDERSYVLEMEDGDNGLPLFLKYENGDALSDILQFDGCISSGKGRFKTKKKRVYRKSEAKSSKIVEFSGFLESQVENEPVYESNKGFQGYRNRRPLSQFDKSVYLSHSIKNQFDSNLADDSYQEFLSHLKLENGLMVMEYNSVTVIYEGNETTDAASEGIFFDGRGSMPFESNQSPSFQKPATEGTCSDKLELVLYESTQPDVTIYEAHERSIVPFDTGISSSFDLNLMAVLSKPYNQDEHEVLWKQANFRKPVLRHKDLRNQSKSFTTAQMGFSYLDHFPELAKKMEHSDPQLALNLLRGLFFWLKNLCHEGAYQPWISSASSNIVEVSDHDMMLLPLVEKKLESETSPPLESLLHGVDL